MFLGCIPPLKIAAKIVRAETAILPWKSRTWLAALSVTTAAAELGLGQKKRAPRAGEGASRRTS